MTMMINANGACYIQHFVLASTNGQGRSPYIHLVVFV